MRFDDVCRVCLKNGCLTSIFTTQKLIGEQSMLCSEMLVACATVTVNILDGLPRQICPQCFRKLCSAYKFRILCEKSFSLLLEHATKEIKIDLVKTEGDDLEFEENFERNQLSNNKVGELSPVKEEDIIKHEKELTIKVLEGKEIDSIDIFQNDDVGSPNNFDDFEIDLNDNENKQTEREKRKLRRAHKRLKKKYKVCKELKKSQDTAEPEALKCSLCPKVFKWKYLLIAHQDSHLGIKRYFCDICQKSYRVEKDHKNMHRRGFKFKCDVCSKCFNTKAKLSIHKNTHSTDREKIICGLDGCTKTFLSMSGLDRHRISHSGLKNFVCHLCSKSFIDKYQLEVHIRTHTNERPYSCGFCEKMFITTSARITHERWHTNTKNYHCQYCDKSFVSSSGLKRHLLCHTKEQHQACRFCGKKFARFDNRKRHEMAMHGITDESTLYV